MKGLHELDDRVNGSRATLPAKKQNCPCDIRITRLEMVIQHHMHDWMTRPRSSGLVGSTSKTCSYSIQTKVLHDYCSFRA